MREHLPHKTIKTYTDMKIKTETLLVESTYRLSEQKN